MRFPWGREGGGMGGMCLCHLMSHLSQAMISSDVSCFIYFGGHSHIDCECKPFL